jgi:hypothetical protein
MEHRGTKVRRKLDMNWDREALDYGYVVFRPPTGGWWHMHFGRAAVAYDCDLLGRCTNIFARVQHFDTGAVAQSPAYTLTLDGEGVEMRLWLDCGWMWLESKHG